MGKRLALRAYNVVMKQTIKSIKKVQGGFSDIRLWPYYFFVGVLTLFLFPRIGSFWSSSLAVLIVVVSVKLALSRLPVVMTDYKSWGKDLERAISKGHKLPSLKNYQLLKTIK